MTQAMDVLTPLEGAWRLHRVIDDRLADVQRIFEGEIEFVRAHGGLVSTEQGRWINSDWRGMAATRTLRWQASGTRVGVLYEDGRPFHDFDMLENGSVSSGHDCAPDRYDVVYRFALPERWDATWTVRGPTKNYRSHSQHHRSASHA